MCLSGGSNGFGGGNRGGDRGEDWNCECGQSNFASRFKCFKCQEPKPGGKYLCELKKKKIRSKQHFLEEKWMFQNWSVRIFHFFFYSLLIITKWLVTVC